MHPLQHKSTVTKQCTLYSTKIWIARRAGYSYLRYSNAVWVIFVGKSQCKTGDAPRQLVDGASSDNGTYFIVFISPSSSLWLLQHFWHRSYRLTHSARARQTDKHGAIAMAVVYAHDQPKLVFDKPKYDLTPTWQIALACFLLTCLSCT
jgi:hypothetical protein